MLYIGESLLYNIFMDSISVWTVAFLEKRWKVFLVWCCAVFQMKHNYDEQLNIKRLRKVAEPMYIFLQSYTVLVCVLHASEDAVCEIKHLFQDGLRTCVCEAVSVARVYSKALNQKS